MIKDQPIHLKKNQGMFMLFLGFDHVIFLATENSDYIFLSCQGNCGFWVCKIVFFCRRKEVGFMLFCGLLKYFKGFLGWWKNPLK